MRISISSNFFLSILGALLLWAAWPTSPLTLLIFVAWVPLLLITENVKSARRFLGYTYLHMVLWNVLTTWWVAKASIIGGVSAFFANSLIMCIPWLLYFFTKKYIRGFAASLSIIVYWLTFEYIHQNWDLSWPWLTLGNVFATHTAWVQWYEYTGTTGGSLWVLISNILVYHTFLHYRQEGRNKKYFINVAAWLLVLLLPIVFSLFVKNKLTLLHNKYNAIVVQPNIDPWNEKFDPTQQDGQLQKLITLSQQQIDANTALVVWPETAIPFQTEEDSLKSNARLEPVWNFLQNNPGINLLTGIEGYNDFNVKPSRYARAIRGTEKYYEMYNSAVLMNSDTAKIYHKSKLVPGAEVLPWFVNFMAPLFEKFGGTTGGYARDTAAIVLQSGSNPFTITPAVCYESIYGDYLADFNRKGSNLICIITNDGWWGNTQGYKQHMNYARLRAIESRKWIARSANTGISSFIDPYGNVVQQLGWNKEGALKQTIAAYTTQTFFTRYGDVTSKIAAALAAALLLLATVYKYKNRNGKTVVNE